VVARKDPSIPGPKVIFSGIQPTGVPHLGNYLGALREWKRLQDTAHPATKLLFCIVDLHAITMPRPSAELYENRMKMLASLLAIGINPERSTIFFQSSVPYHAELQWILSCTASVGYLSRMTQWKVRDGRVSKQTPSPELILAPLQSKMQLGETATLNSPQAKESLKHGLFSYPILQAADILVHRATHVPVGDDQRQHLEFARECVTNFNHTYKTDCLVSPQTMVSPSKRVMSLSNPLVKMSKSDPSFRSHVLITDPPELVIKKFRLALTDSDSAITYDPVWRAGVANLLEILSAFDPDGRNPAQLAASMEGEKMGELKHQVAKAVNAEWAGIAERYEGFMSDKKGMEDIVAKSTSWARSNAGNTMIMVKQAMGLMGLTLPKVTGVGGIVQRSLHGRD
jgi:tryptophanyl-tRNA synthetase